jgi:glycine/D-amino acid oxidase-like deaminating enzyme
MLEYDVLIVGGGIAGLWLGNTLLRAGYNVIVIEKDRLGSGQTLAAQGMIHGGQKYVLEGKVTSRAVAISKMPERWEACLAGRGEVDLSSVRVLSESQVMWPAGSILSAAAVLAAAQLVNAVPVRLRNSDFPEILRQNKKFSGPVYQLPERVLDMRSLILAMAKPLEGRVFKGEVTGVLPEGQVTVADAALRAQAVIFAGGIGNERAFDWLGGDERKTQRRPLRQVMVRPMSHSLFGHGIVASENPRITATSHLTAPGEYVWYLGGNVAEQGARMSETDALGFAKRELTDIFPDIDWGGKQWAGWYGDRAEAVDGDGALAPGPSVHRHGRVLLAWPTKLTFAPALADLIATWLKDLKPVAKSASPPLPSAIAGHYPWEAAAWQRLETT